MNASAMGTARDTSTSADLSRPIKKPHLPPSTKRWWITYRGEAAPRTLWKRRKENASDELAKQSREIEASTVQWQAQKADADAGTHEAPRTCVRPDWMTQSSAEGCMK